MGRLLENLGYWGDLALRDDEINPALPLEPQNMGIVGIFLIMGNAGFMSSTVLGTLDFDGSICRAGASESKALVYGF